MNEHELTAVLTRAGEQLHPDVTALVAGGARRGRRRRRRRRATTAAALGAATVLVVGGLAWQGVPDGDRRGQDPAVATASAPPGDQPGDQRALAPDDVLVERLLDHLPDGEVSDVTTTPVGDEPGSPFLRGLEIALLLDGEAVEVRIYDMSLDPTRWTRDPARPKPDGCDASLVEADKETWNRAVRAAEANAPTFSSPEEVRLTPEQECISWARLARDRTCADSPSCLARRTAYSPKEACGSPECRELPDGSWLWPRSGDGGDGSDTSGFTGNWAGLFAPDGWMVDVAAFNSPDADARGARVTSAQPPLSLDELTALATADLWFE